MITWTWTRTVVAPEDILSALETLRMGSTINRTDLTTHWVQSDTYLGWAKRCLSEGTHFGLDAALCYAKRAVCRQIDGLLLNNHMRRLIDKPYPDKLATLSEIGLSGTKVVQALVIDPRNDIEHDYSKASPKQAEHAVDLATVFLQATHAEADQHAIISFGWSINSTSIGNRDGYFVEFSMKPEHDPMLLIEVSDPDAPTVFILRPKDAEALVCDLNQFSPGACVALAKKLRMQNANSGSSDYSTKSLLKLKSDLGL